MSPLERVPVVEPEHQAVGLLGEDRVNGSRSRSGPPPEVDVFLAGDDPEHEWLIPGLIEARDRIILTGGEGDGKSTLQRQLAMRVAVGMHPFTDETMAPLECLIVDCENSRRQVRRALRPLRDLVEHDWDDGGMLRVQVEPNGLDLLRDRDVDRLDVMLEDSRPDILFIGPLYKLASGDPTDERTARSVAGVLDKLRETYDMALVIEAHVPYAGNGANRPKRPYGASLWSRWPEFGLFLGPGGELEHWRGPRDERAWPKRLQRGGIWPWEPAAPDERADEGWRPTALMERVSARLRMLHAAGEHPTRNALATSTTGKRTYVLQAIDALVADGYIASDGKHFTSIRPFPDQAPT